jgi:hypothetical protein
LFLLEGGAKGGDQPVNYLGGCVASRFKTLSFCEDVLPPCFVIISYALITPDTVIILSLYFTNVNYVTIIRFCYFFTPDMCVMSA